MLCLAMPTDLSFFRYGICIFGDMMEFRRFAHRKHSQSDDGMNLAFLKFDGIIGRIIFIALYCTVVQYIARRKRFFCYDLSNVSPCTTKMKAFSSSPGPPKKFNGSEERDRRLQVVELLTALIYYGIDWSFFYRTCAYALSRNTPVC